MKEGFTFDYASLKILEKVILKNIAGGGKTEKSRFFFQLIVLSL